MAAGSDRLFLEAAVELANRGANATTPNPSVGCLIVKNSEVLGRGWTGRPGEGHAEVNALADAFEWAGADSVRGATVYVSLEPCAFHGRTPPCTEALIRAGVGRVVAALEDPHPQVAGRGFEALRQAGIEVELLELSAARARVAGYVSRISRGRPLLRVKVAASLDGRTAMASGESQWITGPLARKDVQGWRARSCAIITGSETVLADNPALTVREPGLAVAGRIRQPLRVLLDSRLRVPGTARIFSEPGSVLVVHTGGEAHQAPAEHLLLPQDANGRVDLHELLGALAERGMNEVLVEAGPTLTGSFLATRLWDELVVYVAPKLLGSTARPLAELELTHMSEALEARIADCVQIGDDLRLTLLPA